MPDENGGYGNDIRDLADTDLKLIDKYRLFRKPDLSPKSMHHEGALLKQFLSWCVERDFVHANPLAARKFTPPKYAPRGGPGLEQINAVLAAATEIRRPCSRRWR
jgi:hypothetical protein